ncbi:TIGR03503 family protein [Thalassomonas viridans]|uniref:TIGR03503 family protein n=1 Tax=Thalassomonas viridans TaxID=137584 RepID=A0AAF0CBA4_9GAMM|nr:TIGR03503 family protein [Thalassomonas viridans]WDE07336.1 TIGR03503 family protein [Thalassomonas viridans]
MAVLYSRLLWGLVAAFSCVAGAQQLPDEIEYYHSDEKTNQIPYFDNRFRIDAQIDEVTLIFYRRHGSQPIILVRPDGSKLKINNLPEDKVEWFDDSTYDMIKIKKPMPGPWQAIGNILPESKIMVLSEVKIEVESLPEILLAGETLKVTGKLFNGDRAIDIPGFREVINLDVDFYSTNNSAYDNFGAEPIKLTTFRDDGRDLDEYAGDNLFTGEFVLNFAPGEWQPIYLIKLPMATRELRQAPVILHPTPVTIEVDTTNEEEAFHKVHFVIDDSFVDPDSLIFQGNFVFPDRQVEAFSIMEGSGGERIKELAFTEPGIYRVKTRAFGRTKTGREFRLVIPEFAFNVEPKADDINFTVDENGQTKKLTQEEIAQQQAEQRAFELEQERIRQEEEAAERQQQMITIIVVSNLVILVIAVAAFFILRWRKKKPAKQEAKQEEA